jgi:hypothetical protein
VVSVGAITFRVIAGTDPERGAPSSGSPPGSGRSPERSIRIVLPRCSATTRDGRKYKEQFIAKRIDGAALEFASSRGRFGIRVKSGHKGTRVPKHV